MSGLSIMHTTITSGTLSFKFLTQALNVLSSTNILFRKVFVIGINEAYDTAFLTFDVSLQTWTSTIISSMDFNIGNLV